MNLSELQLAQHLKKHGYSLTKPRKVVFTALEDQEAQSMARLVSTCEGQLDRATVYRTISLFESIGIVQRVQIGWKYKLELTDTFSHHHHHLTCRICGKISALSEDSQLEDRLSEIAKWHHFAAEGHQIEIRGLCAECQALQVR